MTTQQLLLMMCLYSASASKCSRYLSQYPLRPPVAYASRNAAQISVTNSNAADTYYQVAGSGSATSVQSVIGAPFALKSWTDSSSYVLK